jgi:hypothetical protein
VVEGRGLQGLAIITGDDTLDFDDENVIYDGTGDATITLPPAAEVPFRVFRIRNASQLVVTLSAISGELIDDAQTFPLYESGCGHERHFGAYDDTGGLDVTAGATVVFDTEKVVHPPFSYDDTTGILTIQRDGLYKIGYDVSLDMTAGGVRSNGRAFLEVNTGGGYAEESGFRGFSYHRSVGVGEDSMHGALQLSLSDGDLLRIRAIRHSSSDTLETIADGSRFLAEYIDQAFEGVIIQSDGSNYRILGGF